MDGSQQQKSLSHSAWIHVVLLQSASFFRKAGGTLMHTGMYVHAVLTPESKLTCSDPAFPEKD
jgi:hypothetical protein